MQRVKTDAHLPGHVTLRAGELADDTSPLVEQYPALFEPVQVKHLGVVAGGVGAANPLAAELDAAKAQLAAAPVAVTEAAPVASVASAAAAAKGTTAGAPKGKNG